MSSLIDSIDLVNLTPEDLQAEYLKLLESFHNLKQLQETDRQQIHELKRNLSVSKAAEDHLNQELEIITGHQDLEIERIQARYQQDIDEIRKKCSELEDYNSNLEQNIENLRLKAEADKITIGNFELKQKNQPKGSLTNSESDRELVLERENIELLKKLDSFQDDLDKASRVIQEKERQIELLKEQLQCAEENLSSKREELEEKANLLESTQERMIEMNSELAMLKAAPENNDRKGNSLFAEVDDQRQIMKQLLATQKKNYLQMKKVYNESEYEIRRLKRENAAMHSELKACTSIYLNAEKTYKEQLNKRILQLLKQNEALEKKLHNREDQLINISNEKGVNWVDSMLTFCKNETRELQAELNSLRLEKSVLDHSLRDSQQELSKWRFEALKSRCIVIDREALLDENLIKFKNFEPYEMQFTSDELETAHPRILDNSMNLNAYKNKVLNVPKILNNATTSNGELEAGNENDLVQLSKFDESDCAGIMHCENSHISLDSSSIKYDSNEKIVLSEVQFDSNKSLQDELSEFSKKSLKEDLDSISLIESQLNENKMDNFLNDMSINKSYNQPEFMEKTLLEKPKVEYQSLRLLKLTPMKQESNQVIGSIKLQNETNKTMNENCVKNVKRSYDRSGEQSVNIKQEAVEAETYHTPKPFKIGSMKRKSNQDIANIEFKKTSMKQQNMLSLDENQALKSVTFDKETKNSPKVNSENIDKLAKTRLKSNIIMKKIVIRSTTEKKSV